MSCEWEWYPRAKSRVSCSAPVAQNEQHHNRPDGNSEVLITPDIIMLEERAGSHGSFN